MNFTYYYKLGKLWQQLKCDTREWICNFGNTTCWKAKGRNLMRIYFEEERLFSFEMSKFGFIHWILLSHWIFSGYSLNFIEFHRGKPLNFESKWISKEKWLKFVENWRRIFSPNSFKKFESYSSTARLSDKIRDRKGNSQFYEFQLVFNRLSSFHNSSLLSNFLHLEDGKANSHIADH